MCKEYYEDYFEEVNEKLDNLTDEEFIKLIDEAIDGLCRKRKLETKGLNPGELYIPELMYSHKGSVGQNPLIWVTIDDIKGKE